MDFLGVFLHPFLNKEMEDIKTEPVDFVREFQEYLTQQTHHVNMISGSVCGEKEPGTPYQAGEHCMHATECNCMETNACIANCMHCK